MANSKSIFNKQSEWFYKLYAHENQLDYLQLCILDILRNSAGQATLKSLFEQIDSSKVAIRLTLEDLARQGMISYGMDVVELSDYARFDVEDVLARLHDQLDRMKESGAIEEVPEHLAA